MDWAIILRDKILPFARKHLRELIVVAFCLLVVHDVFGEHGLIAMRRTQKEAQQIRREIQRLDEENRALQVRAKALKNDPRAIERVAREELNLAKPGELIFKLPQAPNDPANPGQPGSPNPPKN